MIIEVENLSPELLEIYNAGSENRLKRIFEPNLGLFIAESPKVIIRAISAGYEPFSVLAEKKTYHALLSDNGDEEAKKERECISQEDKSLLCRAFANVDVYLADESVISGITGYKLTGGMLCAMKRRILPTVQEVCSHAKRIVILEDVENPTNIGAIFRSAAALGFDGAVLTGGSCDPLYRRAIRVSMGTVFQMPWTILDGKNTPGDGNYLEIFKKMGFITAAMALSENSVSMEKLSFTAEDKVAVIMGSEGWGLKPQTIESSDYVARIPMAHGVDSLNVAAASAIAFWQLALK